MQLLLLLLLLLLLKWVRRRRWEEGRSAVGACQGAIASVAFRLSNIFFFSTNNFSFLLYFNDVYCPGNALLQLLPLMLLLRWLHAARDSNNNRCQTRKGCRVCRVQGAAVCGSPSPSLSLSGQEVRLINVSGPYRVGNPAANKTRKGRRKGRGEGESREARQDNTRA